MEGLYKAAESGNLREVKRLSARLRQLDTPDEHKWTIMHFACLSGNVDLVTFLIDKHIKVNRRTDEGICPLHIAAQNGYAIVIDLLIDSGAVVDAVDNAKRTALHFAVINNRQDATQSLLEAGAKANVFDEKGFTPLHMACDLGSQELVRMLLVKGANPNLVCQNPVLTRNDTCWAPMHVSCQKGDLEILKLMIQYGGSIDVKSSSGASPLHFAAQYPTQLLKFLVDEGADITVTDKDVETPIFAAVRCRQPENVRLLSKKELIEAPNREGKNVCHVCCELGFADILELLLEVKPNLEIATRDTGNTALHIAVLNGYRDCVRLLLDHNANVFVRNKKNRSPLVSASGDIMVLLRNHIQSQGLTGSEVPRQPNKRDKEKAKEGRNRKTTKSGSSQTSKKSSAPTQVEPTVEDLMNDIDDRLDQFTQKMQKDFDNMRHYICMMKESLDKENA